VRVCWGGFRRGELKGQTVRYSQSLKGKRSTTTVQPKDARAKAHVILRDGRGAS